MINPGMTHISISKGGMYMPLLFRRTGKFIVLASFLLVLLFPYEAFSQCPCWGDSVSQALVQDADRIICTKTGGSTFVRSEEVDPDISCPDFIEISASANMCTNVQRFPFQPNCAYSRGFSYVPDTMCKDMLDEFCLNLNGDLCNGQLPTIPGTDGDDDIMGTPGDDIILGFAGNDIIEGGGGTDSICSGPGNDRVTVRNGQRFRDPIRGGAGAFDKLVFAFKVPTHEARAFCESLEGLNPDRDSMTIDDILYEWIGFEEIICEPDIMIRPIPTLSEWGLIAMAGALGIVCIIAMRKRVYS